MTVRNLEYVFKPASVALIGASPEPGSVGVVTARNLFGGGFAGPIMPVNPRHHSIEGVLTYPDIASLPETPDLAVIATPAETVPGIVAELGERGTKAAVVITAGFGEGADVHGKALQTAMLEAARPHLMRIVGPNCVGVMVPGIGLNAGFAHIAPQPGKLAFVAQSGAVLTSVLDWATGRGIGFSHMVSLGDMADVDFGDMLDYLARDADTRAILLYVEAVREARKFMSAARAAARAKPVIAIKAGRHEEGARAAASHTGALAGADKIYDAAFRRAGMLRVFEMDELFDAVETLAKGGRPHGDRLAIVSNGGGIGVLATDSLIDRGGTLARLGDETMARLDAALPPTWSHGNPVDIIGDAPPGRYAEAVDALLDDPGVDAALVLNCPTAVASSTEAARAVIEAAGERRDRVLTSWLGSAAVAEARQLFAEHRIPSYDTPDQAVRAFLHMVQYRRNQETLMETPPSVPEAFTPDQEAARAVMEAVLDDGRVWLMEPEAKAVLAAYGIPVARTLAAETPQQAAAHAAELGGPVALKILSPDILHKSDIGGVALDLAGPTAVRAAAEAMLERAQAAAPDARLRGFAVEPMVRWPGAHELIVGVTDDVQFGPVILFGHGGTAVEVIADEAVALPPLNMRLAHEVMSRTRIHRLLVGYRERPPAALDEIALALLKVAQLVTDFAEIEELDINPLLAEESGVLALDARIRLDPKARGQAPTARLAIRPYPNELEETVELEDGRRLLMRPVRPEDEPMFHEGFKKLSAEDIRLRFFTPLRRLSHDMAARLTQIDYDREMALVLADPAPPGTAEIYGVARITADPDNERAEFAIIVRSDMKGKGLGWQLMQRLIEHARRRGIGEMYGEVLAENVNMLKLAENLGFSRAAAAEEAGIVEVRLTL